MFLHKSSIGTTHQILLDDDDMIGRAIRQNGIIEKLWLGDVRVFWGFLFTNLLSGYKISPVAPNPQKFMDAIDVISSYLAERAGLFLLVSSGTALLALGISGVLAFKLRSLFRPFSLPEKTGGGEAAHLVGLAGTAKANRQAIERMRSDMEGMFEESKSYLRHVGLVRYNAFDDIGGKQSYSLCLLDSKKNGVIITYLTSRNSTRSYAVWIESGKTSRELSVEESKALEEALSAPP